MEKNEFNEFIAEYLRLFLKKITLEMLQTDFTEEFFMGEEEEIRNLDETDEIENMVDQAANRLTKDILTALKKQGISSLNEFEDEKNKRIIEETIAQIINSNLKREEENND